MERDIIEQNRHMFIYGPNGIERQKFINKLVSDYPIMVGQYVPMAIYLEQLSLPDIDNPEVDKLRKNILLREYLINNIAYQMINNLISQVDVELISDKIMGLLSYVDSDITDLRQLSNALKICSHEYKEAYVEYLKSSKFILNISELPIDFFNIEQFTSKLKECLDNNAFFNIIIDQQEEFSLDLQKAINWLVTKRINKNISMKIFCEKDSWKTPYDLDGEVMEFCHDYGTHKINDFSKVLKN